MIPNEILEAMETLVGLLNKLFPWTIERGFYHDTLEKKATPEARAVHRATEEVANRNGKRLFLGLDGWYIG